MYNVIKKTFTLVLFLSLSGCVSYLRYDSLDQVMLVKSLRDALAEVKVPGQIKGKPVKVSISKTWISNLKSDDLKTTDLVEAIVVEKFRRDGIVIASPSENTRYEYVVMVEVLGLTHTKTSIFGLNISNNREYTAKINTYLYDNETKSIVVTPDSAVSHRILSFEKSE